MNAHNDLLTITIIILLILQLEDGVEMMDNDLLLQDIDQIYYVNEDEFNISHLTSQLPENLTSDYLVTYKRKLERSLSLVSKKVSELILDHQPAYVEELKRISDLQKSLNESIKSCSETRSCLNVILNGGTKTGAIVIEHYKKRETLINLLSSLTTINDLRKSVLNIRQLIDQQDDFPKAIKICRDGKSMLDSFHEYECVKDMNKKLNLLLMNHDFSGYRFDEFIQVLGIVDYMIRIGDDFNGGSGSSASNEILNCINSQAFNFFNAYHKQSMEEQKMFLENELWEMIPVKSDFKLGQLKEFHFLRSNNSVNKQHQTMISHQPSQATNSTTQASSSLHDQMQFYNEQIGESIDNNCGISHDANKRQQMIKFTSIIPFDTLLDSSKELKEDLFGGIGPDSEAESIIAPLDSHNQDSILKRQASSLLLDKISLSSTESDDDDDEHLNPELNRDFVDEGDDDDIEDNNLTPDTKLVSPDYTNPRDKSNITQTNDQKNTRTTDLMSKNYSYPRISSSSHNSNNNNNQFSSQTRPSTSRFNLTRSPGPVLTNSSLNILRLVGRYIQMMIVLKPISYEILMRIYSLLEFYTMVVYKKFGPDVKSVSNTTNDAGKGKAALDEKINLSPKLRQVMRSIRASLVGTGRLDLGPSQSPSTTNTLNDPNDRDHSLSTQATSAGSNFLQPHGPNISNIITEEFLQVPTSPQQNQEPINSQKAVAIESLIYLVNQLWNLQEFLESLIPAEMRPQLREQFTQSNSIVPDFLRARAEMESRR